MQWNNHKHFHGFRERTVSLKINLLAVSNKKIRKMSDKKGVIESEAERGVIMEHIQVILNFFKEMLMC